MLEACKSGLYSVFGHTCSKNMETFKGNYGDNKIQNWGNNYQRERGNSRNRIGNEDKEGRFVSICIAFSLNTTEINRQKVHICLSKVQFSSVAQSYLTLCNPMNRSTPGLPVQHQLPESTQTHAHRVGDTIQPSHPLSSPSPPAPNPSQYQGLFQWVNSSHEVAKVLEFQLQHQSFQWTPRTDLL